MASKFTKAQQGTKDVKRTQIVVETKEKFEPRIYITPHAYEKQNIIIEESPVNEVGWFGWARETSPGVYHILDMMVPDQEVHATTCAISAKGTWQTTQYAEEKLVPIYGEAIQMEERVWGHSHVNMGISPSKQDRDTMQEYANEANGFYIALIGNRKGEIDYRVIIPERNEIWEYVPWEVKPLATENDESEALEEELKALLGDRVTEKVTTYSKPATRSYTPGTQTKIGFEMPSGNGIKPTTNKDPRAANVYLGMLDENPEAKKEQPKAEEKKKKK